MVNVRLVLAVLLMYYLLLNLKIYIMVIHTHMDIIILGSNIISEFFIISVNLN